ncbi:hypothetical protein SAMN05216216_10236 [Lacicoccus qingdaonensis]|uniref:Uncharacterized protein n=2 Tax=Lacicoccus qingdaonensis TaxID=576118 RepID=A0A1G9AY91_9BACL|nr:hypothetical protein SAMN05216216_10236 [Salinicoccus qingdaonensis]
MILFNQFNVAHVKNLSSEKAGAVMFVRIWKKKDSYYAAVVKSVRDGKKVRQETVCYLGVVEENQVPYLKAAYSKNKPKLLYEDGRIYDGRKK